MIEDVIVVEEYLSLYVANDIIRDNLEDIVMKAS